MLRNHSRSRYQRLQDYARDGNLGDYLENYRPIDFRKKFQIISQIIKGLCEIHQKELIHKDLHPGNILKKANKFMITDLGSCRPAYIKTNKVYGSYHIWHPRFYAVDLILRHPTSMR